MKSSLLILLSLLLANQTYPPTRLDNDITVSHFAYTLSYSEFHEQAFWVYYNLKSSHIDGNVGRTNDFRPDGKIKTRSAQLADYKGSGYDRGHLAPAGDFKWSYAAMSESFFMSNISPQLPGFNRGIWKKLEQKVRNWAIKNDQLHITTGPILNGKFKKIGPNNVSVPNYYYKVVLDYQGPEVKAIGFILPNKKSSKELIQYAVTVNKVEEMTGFDFFYSLPDTIEEKLESSFDYNKW